MIRMGTRPRSLFSVASRAVACGISVDLCGRGTPPSAVTVWVDARDPDGGVRQVDHFVAGMVQLVRAVDPAAARPGAGHAGGLSWQLLCMGLTWREDPR